MKTLFIITLCSFLFSSTLFAGELLVSAASSLTDAVKSIAYEFEKQNKGIKISLNFASSGTLRGQIEKGAPVDVFLSASSRHMDILEKKGQIINNSRIDFARNTLCLIAPKKNVRISINDFNQLAQSGVTRVAIGSPKSVPVGRYAKQTLEHLKLWKPLLNRFIYGENVRQVLDYVSRGEVDFGVVYTTDAFIRMENVSIVKTVPTNYHTPIIYPAAVVRGTRKTAKGKQFVEFLKSKVAQKILLSYGFSVK